LYWTPSQERAMPAGSVGAGRGTPLALAGRLGIISLPEVLQMLASSRASGVLTLVRSGVRERAEIELVCGQIVRADLGEPGGLLGAVLLRERTVDAGRLGEALRVSQTAASTKPLASVLLEMEAVPPSVLASAIAEQIELTLARVLRWDRGLFSFRSSDELPSAAADDLRVQLDAHATLLSAARRSDEYARLR
jgi:hypothetical protein